jgi:aspartate kinase
LKMKGNKNKNKKKPNRLVVKFGGSSVADGPGIAHAADLVIKKASQGVQIAVVVSAMGKTTDSLIDTADKACGKTVPDDELDDIVAMGERTSARVFAAALRARGKESRHIDPSGSDWPIITDNAFLNAKPILSTCYKLIRQHIQPLLEKDIVVVVPGFIGRTEDGRTSTMGRGGSDISALMLGQALSADRVILVTDVEGIMTADPKVIKKPKLLKEIPMDVLVGLADSSTKFIHKKALRYKSPEIDIKVVSNSSEDLDSEGTIIKGSFPSSILVELHPEPAIAVTIVGRQMSESTGTLAEILHVIRKVNIPLLGMSVNHNSLILYLPMRDCEALLEALHAIVVRDEKALAMAVRRDLAFVRVRGVGLEETPGVISSITKALNSAGVNIYGAFTITSSVVIFVDLKDEKKTIRLMKETIATNNNKPVAKLSTEDGMK